MKHTYYLSFLFLILISTILFISIDYLVQTNLDNLNIIMLKNKSKNDLANLDTITIRLNKKLQELKQESTDAELLSYPTLPDLKQISNKYTLRISNVNKIKEIRNSQTLYRLSINGSVYNILRFLRSFESKHIMDVEQLSLGSNDHSGELVKLELSILLET